MENETELFNEEIIQRRRVCEMNFNPLCLSLFPPQSKLDFFAYTNAFCCFSTEISPTNARVGGIKRRKRDPLKSRVIALHGCGHDQYIFTHVSLSDPGNQTLIQFEPRREGLRDATKIAKQSLG